MSSYSFKGRKRVWIPRDQEENRVIFSTQKKESDIQMPDEFLPVYLENAQYEVEKWSVGKLMRLLRLYASHRCLWDIRIGDYGNRKLRRAALIDLTAAMGGGVSQEQVVQKINVLRATYRYEKRRIKQRMLKGMGAKTKLKWFPLADAFLRNVPRQSRKCQEDSDLEDTVVFTVDPEALIPLEEDEGYIRNVLKKKVRAADDYMDQQSPLASEHNVIDNSEKVPSKPKHKVWTSAESIEFIKLLKDHPKLWDPKFAGDNESDERDLAIESIADVLQMKKERISRRVYTFKIIYQQEIEKIAINSAYRPPFVWWPLVAEFMSNTESAAAERKEAPSHFVDANAPPPATPAEWHRREYENPGTPINPIPSIPPPQSMDDDEDTNAGRSPSTPTKFIWNGLEDDLLEGKWSLKHSVKFLRLYGAHRCLWDLNDVNYRSRIVRQAAVEDIAACMGHGLSAEYVVKKIRIFRITYMQHRKRMLASIKQGMKPDIQLRWFPLADSFLRPHIGLRSIQEHEQEMPQFDYQYVYANLNLTDPALLSDLRGKGTQNTIEIGDDAIRRSTAKECDDV